MKKLLSLTILLLISACGHSSIEGRTPIKTSKDYNVTSIEVSLAKTAKNHAHGQKLINATQKAISSRLQKHNKQSGRNVKLQLEVTEINLETNSLQMALIGDNATSEAALSLIDSTTNKEIGAVQIHSGSKPVGLAEVIAKQTDKDLSPYLIGEIAVFYAQTIERLLFLETDLRKSSNPKNSSFNRNSR